MTPEVCEILQCKRGDERDALAFFEHVANSQYFLQRVRDMADGAARNAAMQDLNNQMRYAHERGRCDAFTEIAAIIESAPRRLAELREVTWTS